MIPTQAQIDAFQAAGGGLEGLSAAMAILQMPVALIDAIHSRLLVRLTTGLAINVVDGSAYFDWPDPAAVRADVLAELGLQ